MNGGELECMTVDGLRQLIEQTEARCAAIRQRLDANDSHEMGLQEALEKNQELLARYRQRLTLMDRESK
jgi:hypothetical protein